MSDPVIEAMRAGAGLPVLTPLDRHLEARALDDVETADASDIVDDVLEAIDGWLDQLEDRTRTKLDACDEGPLVVRMRGHVDETLETARARVDEMPATAGEARWEALIGLLGDLHEVRDDLHAVQRVCGHLTELSRLVGDVPDDAAGRRALDELSAREAEAAARDDPTAWLETGRDLERRALQAIRLDQPDRQDVPSLVAFEAPEPTSDEPTITPPEEPDPLLDDAALSAADALPRVTLEAASNGHEPSSSNEEPDSKAQEPSREPPTTTPRASEHRTNGTWDAHEAEEPGTSRSNGAQHHNGTPQPPTSQARTGYDDPAGAQVLSTWESDRDDGTFRHGPLWAPIRKGEVVPGEGTKDELLEHARDVEIDLVDLELPRVLAIRTSSDAAKVRARIAERAEQITRREPTRPAREAFLDYITGKLPKRYRQTSAGLALVESIAHALCTDDPWTTAGPDYHDTVREMIDAELRRTPALDVAELAGSLVGPSADARSTVQQAASELAADDPDVTFHEDGVLVRPTAAREDPDSLYDLRESLKRRLPEERAQELVETLITTPEQEDPR